jgi:hypothetical protein
LSTLEDELPGDGKSNAAGGIGPGPAGAAADVFALVSGCLARQPDPGDPAARDRLVAVVRAGLKTAASSAPTIPAGPCLTAPA